MTKLHQYEYKIIVVSIIRYKGSGGDTLDQLNRLGQLGWELVTVIPHNATSFKYFFKRRII